MAYYIATWWKASTICMAPCISIVWIPVRVWFPTTMLTVPWLPCKLCYLFSSLARKKANPATTTIVHTHMHAIVNALVAAMLYEKGCILATSGFGFTVSYSSLRGGGGGGGGGSWLHTQKKQGALCTYPRGGTTRFKCHVINSRIMRANKAKECNYHWRLGRFLLNLNLPFQRFAMLLGSRERFIRESK